MNQETITASPPLKGTIRVPGDKSMSHRAVMFGAIAHGKTTVDGFLPGADCLRTIACFQEMGVSIEQKGQQVIIEGRGLEGLRVPEKLLDVGNSGTTIRIMLGLLAGRSFFSVIAGDDSIAKRPMARVTKPLREMGAKMYGREDAKHTPIAILEGGQLQGIEYDSPVASAQVKSALLLAGLQAQGLTTIREPYRSRDHTERMLQAFGVDVDIKEREVTIEGGQHLEGRTIQVPGDISSAAFFLAAAAIVPGSRVQIENVGVNPTRTGILDALKKMGADLTYKNERMENGEPVADIVLYERPLHGAVIEGSLIPRLIDEIPVLAVMATQANGRTVIKDASELKFKETNRIDTTVEQLRRFGANITATDDGMVIDGPTPLIGTEAYSYHDHRIGMAFAVAGLAASGATTIQGAEAVAISYPEFFPELRALVNQQSNGIS